MRERVQLQEKKESELLEKTLMVRLEVSEGVFQKIYAMSKMGKLISNFVVILIIFLHLLLVSIVVGIVLILGLGLI
jgi:hypothetical protein